MSKKSKKRKQNRTKNRPVRYRSAHGDSMFGFPHLRGGYPVSRYKSQEISDLEQKEFDAAMLGLPEDEIERYCRVRDEKDAAMMEETPFDFWVSELDTPEDIVKRYFAIPEAYRAEIMEYALKPLCQNSNNPETQKLATVATYMIEHGVSAVTPSEEPKPSERKRKRPNLTITPEDEERWKT